MLTFPREKFGADLTAEASSLELEPGMIPTSFIIEGIGVCRFKWGLTREGEYIGWEYVSPTYRTVTILND